MTQPNSPSPGWYPDPSGVIGRRYWDGERWDMDRVEEPVSLPPDVFRFDPIVVSVDESYLLDQRVFDRFPLSNEVREQLAALLRSDSADEISGICEAILTAVMTLETQLVPKLIDQSGENIGLSTKVLDLKARLIELETRILRAGIRLPPPEKPY